MPANEYLMGEDGRGAAVPADGTATTSSQLTVEDIQRMNGGEAQLVFNDAGYLTFLNGKYCEERINDHEDAVASLNAVAALLGLGAGSEFFAKYGSTDDDGYTYYIFQQRYGDVTVQNGTLRVVVDPDGYTAGLSCSFQPNIGIAEETSGITPEEAIEIARATQAQHDLTFYPEYTAKVAVTFDNVVYNAYAVYSNNPYAGQSFDMIYCEHFISYAGEYLYVLPVASPTTENTDPYKGRRVFRGAGKRDLLRRCDAL